MPTTLLPGRVSAQAGCLDYVLLHELAHLRVKDHRPEFTAILDEFMPYWRDIRKELNDSTLDYLPEAVE